MNKKVLTLCAGLVLAGGVNVWGQTLVNNGSSVTVATPYALQKTTFTQFEQEEATSEGKMNFPTVSPFKICPQYGAKPIAKLNKVNQSLTGTESDGRYFQFVVSESFNSATAKKGDGTEVLTMVWKNATATAPEHFEVQVENVKNANVPENRITLDRTLWKVTAKKDAAGTVLYYEFQNKASQAILQLGIDNVIGQPNADGEQEIALDIVNGQTNWRWADGDVASEDSKIGTGFGKVLQNQMRAQYSNGTTIYLAIKKSTGNVYSLGAVKLNSNKPFAAYSDAVTINGATFYPLSFEAWEANPIILTAAQINAELGNEDLQTADKQTPNEFNFEFEVDVQGAENIMKQYTFKAVDAKPGFDRLPGEAPDGYVRFVNANDESQILRVDTAYHDAASNSSYDLKLAVDKLTYPRGAVQKDGASVNGDGELNVSDENLYKAASDAPYTARAFAQLNRQANFRPIFYPATQSLRLQAEMIYRADKRSSEPWWKQMAEDAMYNQNSTDHNTTNVINATSGKYMLIAEYAADPAGVNVVNNPDGVRGYYPSYTQEITAAGVVSQDDDARLIQYEKAWKKTDYAAGSSARNGYCVDGADDDDKMLWNAVGNIYQGSQSAADASTSFGSTSNVKVWDPAASASSGTLTRLSTSASSNQITNGDAEPVIYAPQYALAHSNLVRITTLTGDHRVLTADVHDMTDETYNGLNTYITLATVKTEPDLDEIARIDEGFYYIQNANKKNAELVSVDEYRYEDLAATNATFAYWNAESRKWDRGNAPADMKGAKEIGNYLNTVLGDNEGINEDFHKTDRANVGNLVYSVDKKVIPSAQWYIKGNGGYYTIINRESGREWGTSYWWKTSEPDVYVNIATYEDATGLQQSYRDTIRISAIPAADLSDPHMGYLNLEQAVALADTVNYNVGMTIAGVTFSLVEDENGVLTLSQAEGASGDYKLERVLVSDKDKYTQATYSEDELVYGYLPENTNGVDSARLLLKRAKYYIYKDDVSANTGSEESSIKTRQYITLNAGKYQLTPVKVSTTPNGYSYNTEVDEVANTEGVKVRRAFYIKQMSTVQPNQYVLVDPNVVTATSNGTSTKTAYGARLFANQLTSEIQPSSLISDGTSNAYASSIFSVDRKLAYNYIDIRPAGADRDTVEFFATKTDGQYLLSENSNVTGAYVGLLESLDQRLNKNNSLFLDTANVQNPEFPRFYLGLRSKDSVEVSNLDNHNRHIFTEADYLINMVDSAKTNSAYVYKNQAFNNTDCYRLGFIRARHHVDGRLEFLGKTTFQPLAKEEMNIATYAFRYANADRNPNEFYIETMYDANTKGWLATINHVLVVTPDIQQAEVFSMNTEVTDDPTANETIAAENNAVSVVATDGAVIVKGAEGKNVVIATILGKVVANETVNSDNETIAVPAGIAVVSVDGESFKVVVK